MATLDSSWTATGSATLSLTTWWLKVATDSTLQVAVRVDRSWAPKKKNSSGTFYPPGRGKAVVTHGGWFGVETELPIWVLNETDYNTLVSILTANKTLLIQNVLGQQWFIEVVGDLSMPQFVAVAASGEVYPVRFSHHFSVNVVEVDEPSSV